MKAVTEMSAKNEMEANPKMKAENDMKLKLKDRKLKFRN